MSSKYNEIDLSGLTRSTIADRVSRVKTDDFAHPHRPGAGVDEFIGCLPSILAGESLRTVIDRIATAAAAGRGVVTAMGAHVIKCGLSPIIIDLMRRRVITTVALNGAGAIHDSEIALFGCTSEDVESGMRDGSFGMATETAGFLNCAACSARDERLGFGESLGRRLLDTGAPHVGQSILAAAYQCSVPVTVHVSIGSDIVHMHPEAEGGAIGDASMRDFRVLTQAMSRLGGGVLMNIGSAVVLPEVILKALTSLVNLGHDLRGVLGVNLDFVQQYRSNQQIVNRIGAVGGEGISLTGHHEILVPLIAAGVIERLTSRT